MTTAKRAPGWVQALGRPVDLRTLVGRPAKPAPTRSRGRRPAPVAPGPDPLDRLAGLVTVSDSAADDAADPSSRLAALRAALAASDAPPR